mgnify:CR=1 FL=1
MRITPEDVEHVSIHLWGGDKEAKVTYRLWSWEARSAPRVLEFPKIVRYMGKQRKVTWVLLMIDRDFLSESKRIKVRVPEGVYVDFYLDDDEKYYDIETY